MQFPFRKFDGNIGNLEIFPIFPYISFNLVSLMFPNFFTKCASLHYFLSIFPNYFSFNYLSYRQCLHACRRITALSVSVSSFLVGLRAWQTRIIGWSSGHRGNFPSLVPLLRKPPLTILQLRLWGLLDHILHTLGPVGKCALGSSRAIAWQILAVPK